MNSSRHTLQKALEVVTWGLLWLVMGCSFDKPEDTQFKPKPKGEVLSNIRSLKSEEIALGNQVCFLLKNKRKKLRTDLEFKFLLMHKNCAGDVTKGIEKFRVLDILDEEYIGSGDWKIPLKIVDDKSTAISVLCKKLILTESNTFVRGDRAHQYHFSRSKNLINMLYLRGQKEKKGFRVDKKLLYTLHNGGGSYPAGMVRSREIYSYCSGGEKDIARAKVVSVEKI